MGTLLKRNSRIFSEKPEVLYQKITVTGGYASASFWQFSISASAQECVFVVVVVFPSYFPFSRLRFGRKKPLVYNMILASFASVGAVLCTMYDPGADKGRNVF